jgi:hypothetical protein
MACTLAGDDPKALTFSRDSTMEARFVEDCDAKLKVRLALVCCNGVVSERFTFLPEDSPLGRSAESRGPSSSEHTEMVAFGEEDFFGRTSSGVKIGHSSDVGVSAT